MGPGSGRDRRSCGRSARSTVVIMLPVGPQGFVWVMVDHGVGLGEGGQPRFTFLVRWPTSLLNLVKELGVIGQQEPQKRQRWACQGMTRLVLRCRMQFVRSMSCPFAASPPPPPFFSSPWLVVVLAAPDRLQVEQLPRCDPEIPDVRATATTTEGSRDGAEDLELPRYLLHRSKAVSGVESGLFSW